MPKCILETVNIKPTKILRIYSKYATIKFNQCNIPDVKEDKSGSDEGKDSHYK